MDAQQLGYAAPSDPARTGSAARWIQSARFDLVFFILSPLVAIPVLIVAPEGYSVLALVAGALLGTPHYLSTFVFYFWDETRAQHRARWVLFFVGPVLIVATLAVAAVFRIPYVIQVTVYLWNTYHVARQNCGILSIYRHRAGAKDPALKTIANTAIVSTSLALAFWNIAWYPTMFNFLTLVWRGLPQAVIMITAVAAAVSLARLASSLVQRFRSAQPPALPELLFLATSLLIFHPYLWIHDSNRATLGMLLGHFLQYLGIVWLVHRRKFARLRGPASQPWLATLSTSLPALLAVMLLAGLAFLVGQVISDRGRMTRAVYEGGYLALALVHFYLDGLFWAFRRPEVRQSLGPYVMAGQLPPPSMEAAAIR